MSKYVIATPYGRSYKRTEVRGSEADAVALAISISPRKPTLREAVAIEESHALRETRRVGTLWCNLDGTFAYERGHEPLLATIEWDAAAQEYAVSGYTARTSGSYWYGKKELIKAARNLAGDLAVDTDPDVTRMLGQLWTPHSAIAFDDGEVRTTVVAAGRKYETTYVHVLLSVGCQASSTVVASLPKRAAATLETVCGNGRTRRVSETKKRRVISFGQKDQTPRSTRLIEVASAAVEKRNSAPERDLS